MDFQVCQPQKNRVLCHLNTHAQNWPDCEQACCGGGHPKRPEETFFIVAQLISFKVT